MSEPSTSSGSKAQDPGLPLSCECGYIKMRTPSSTPLGTAHCHCTSCRKQSASMFGTSVYFPTAKVFPLSEELESKLSVFRHSTDSGNIMNCYFCPRCGVRILHVADMADGSGKRGLTSFKGGVFDDGGIDWPSLNTRHIFTQSAVMKLEDGWDCYERYPESLAVKKEDGKDEKKE
ncbi:Mss4-like protein [Rhypophila decipiens]|uniref:Mss4-like protein n=1 Tax=Rhypophila decipiens TaxID=261697 RepID=A0AAN7B5E5_9PEZI|nr:Mss4-like protein [Rhypophila decipiens]